MSEPASPETESPMKTTVQQLSPVLVEVQVEVPWTKVNDDLEAAYRVLQKQARVRGFRPGKVPRGVVKQLMGKAVAQDVTKALVEAGLGEAVKTHELRAVAVPEVDEPTITAGQPLTFKAKVEVQPSIEKVEMSNLAVDRVTQAVDDAAVDAELEKLRDQNAELIAPDSPRPAAKGDIVTVDISVTVEGQEHPELASTDARAQLGAEELLADIEQAIVGLSTGESKTATHTFSEAAPDEKLRGKPAEFRITLKQIQEKVLPELDDEFAKDLDKESLEELRASIRSRLEDTERQRSSAQLREAVVDKLIDDNPIPVPPSLIDQQHRAIAMEYLRFQRMLGQSFPMDEDTLASFRTRAERKIRAGVLFGEIARREEIEVGDEDVEKKLAELAEESGKHIAKVRADYQGERLDDLRNQLLHDKLLEYLLSQATITEVTSEQLAERKAQQEAEAVSTPGDDKGEAGDEEASAQATEAEQAKPKKATKKKATKKKATKEKATKEKAPKPEPAEAAAKSEPASGARKTSKKATKKTATKKVPKGEETDT